MMAAHQLSQLLILLSLSNDFYISGLTYNDDPKDHFKVQSWKKQNLHSVPLGLDVRLRRLDLSDNFIRQLHKLALPYLEQLDLSSNQLGLISEGAFEDLAGLEELTLSRNSLNNNVGRNSKALQSMGRLRRLDLSSNGLSDDAVERYLRNKSSLDHLKMSGNVITRLSHSLFKESEALRSIALDDNLISAIEPGTFEPLTQLETLDLAQNNLGHICDFKLHQVKFLNLSRNSVEFFFSHEDEHLYRLETLDLSHNKLLYFPIVPKKNHLRFLHLQHNLIGTLNSESIMVSEANAVYSGVIRERIALKNNLHSNWRLMPLVHIDLSYNHFRSFPLETLSLLSSLETLNFSHNCLQNITWIVRNNRQLYFPSLKHLDMQSNGLVHISPLFLNALRRIETLNLQDNAVQPCASMGHLQTSHSTQPMDLNLSCLAFDRLRTLKHLNLKENNIKTLHPNTFQRVSLISLNLAGNAHMAMQVGALQGLQKTLQTLVISGINMSSSALSLPCMRALNHLNMSDNRLHLLPNSLRCSPLRIIDIRNNRFVSLNASLILRLSRRLDLVYISGNYFNCCDSKWLAILQELKIKLPDVNQTVCLTNDRDSVMQGFVNETSERCSFRPKTQEIHIGQMIVIVLFLTVMVTVIVLFTKEMFCTQKSFIV